MTAAETFETAAPAAPGTRLEISLRPGVAFPDWPAITSEPAAGALVAILEAFGAETRWSGLGDGEDRVRRAILETYPRIGHAPSIDELALTTGFAPDQVRGLVAKLATRDMVILDRDGATITGAYPFVDRDTEHRVHLGETVLNAMCAIDALGTGAMLGIDVIVESSCRSCGTPIRVQMREKGAALGDYAPTDAVVWTGIQYANSCAADSLCTVIAFFCSDQHLVTWRDAKHPGGKGFRLSMDQGLQVGKAIFTPLLAAGSANL